MEFSGQMRMKNFRLIFLLLDTIKMTFSNRFKEVKASHCCKSNIPFKLFHLFVSVFVFTACRELKAFSKHFETQMQLFLGIRVIFKNRIVIK